MVKEKFKDIDDFEDSDWAHDLKLEEINLKFEAINKLFGGDDPSKSLFAGLDELHQYISTLKKLIGSYRTEHLYDLLYNISQQVIDANLIWLNTEQIRQKAKEKYLHRKRRSINYHLSKSQES